MPKIDHILAQMKQNPRDVRFKDLCKVCDHFFAEPRQSGSSHRIYKTPWQGKNIGDVDENNHFTSFGNWKIETGT